MFYISCSCDGVGGGAGREDDGGLQQRAAVLAAVRAAAAAMSAAETAQSAAKLAASSPAVSGCQLQSPQLPPPMPPSPPPSPRILFAGASHMRHLQNMVRNMAGTRNYEFHSLPNCTARVSDANLERVVSWTNSMHRYVTDVLVLDPVGNSFARNLEHPQYLPEKDGDGTYHYNFIGLPPVPSVENMVQTVRNHLAEIPPTVGLVVLPPLPRYASGGCCPDPCHMQGREDTFFGEYVTTGNAFVKAMKKLADIFPKLRILTYKELAGAPQTEPAFTQFFVGNMLSDNVHYKFSAYSRMAVQISQHVNDLVEMGENAAGDRAPSGLVPRSQQLAEKVLQEDDGSLLASRKRAIKRAYPSLVPQQRAAKSITLSSDTESDQESVATSVWAGDASSLWGSAGSILASPSQGPATSTPNAKTSLGTQPWHWNNKRGQQDNSNNGGRGNRGRGRGGGGGYNNFNNNNKNHNNNNSGAGKGANSWANQGGFVAASPSAFQTMLDKVRGTNCELALATFKDGQAVESKGEGAGQRKQHHHKHRGWNSGRGGWKK